MALEVLGNVENITVTGNQCVGGAEAFSLRAQPHDRYYKARRDQREPKADYPRNVIFANNIAEKQTGRYLTIIGIKGMTGLFANNIFKPSSGAFADIKNHLGDLSISNNMLQDSNLKIPDSFHGQGNLILE